MTLTTPLIAAALVLMSHPSPLVVHGEGVLTADRSSAAPGETLALQGSEFEPGEAYRIQLVGALEEFVLATVTPDGEGRFTLTVSLPEGAKEGSYKLQAIAPDGDLSATLDLAILAPAPLPSESRKEPMAGMPEGSGPMGMSGDVAIARDQSGMAWAIIGGLIALAAGLGIGLLVRGKSDSLDG